MSSDPVLHTTAPSGEPDWKRAAEELHKALWMALKEADGEIVLTKKEQDAAGKPGFIDWLSGPDGLLVIRARENADGHG